jgi:hypothetical protein
VAHDGNAGFNQMPDNVGVSLRALDLDRVGAGAQKPRGAVQRIGLPFAGREKGHVGHHEFSAGAADDGARVQLHDFRRRAERVLLAVHDHHRAVADEEAVDRGVGEQARGPRVIGRDHDELCACSLCCREAVGVAHGDARGRFLGV